MAGTEPGPVLAMKVLVEGDMVAPERIGLEQFALAEDGTSTSPPLVLEEDPDQARRELVGGLIQGHLQS